jgi:hypothetical protein
MICGAELRAKICDAELGATGHVAEGSATSSPRHPTLAAGVEILALSATASRRVISAPWFMAPTPEFKTEYTSPRVQCEYFSKKYQIGKSTGSEGQQGGRERRYWRCTQNSNKIVLLFIGREY